MNDELETRLRDAFRNGSLPAAPGRLLDHLDEVTTAPLERGSGGDAGTRGGRRPWGALAVAAALLLGGAVALSVGTRGPGPVPPAGPSPSVPTAAGPIQLIYEFVRNASEPEPALKARTVEIVQGRLDATGLVGPQVSLDGQGRIIVDLQPVPDLDAIRRLIAATGEVGFVPLGSTPVERGTQLDSARFPALIDSSEVSGAMVVDDQMGQPALQILFTGTGGEKFGAYTTAHIGSSFAIVIDGTVIAAPTINEAILDGIVQITFPTAEADRTELARLATMIRLEPLPVAIAEVTNAPGTSPSAPIAADPSAVSLKLNIDRGDVGCDTIRTAYRSLVFRIDPSAADPVRAIGDNGQPLRTFWSASFRGGTSTDPVVYDSRGLVVARDGTRIDVPEAGWPSLAGYFVCPSPDAIYVFDQPPPA